MTTVNPFLLIAALLLLLAWLIPPATDCWLPIGAETRGFYEGCWGFWEIWI